MNAAEGDNAGALVHFRAALRSWLGVGAPVSAAQTRCRIADLLTAQGDAESANVERDAAAAAFAQAGADGLANQCRRRTAAGRPETARGKKS